ncbi:HypC/HybG/HupF family hydrogenase formation chaperone [Sideroxydans lithotrophicus]|uniref:Hydrogenase maturation protease n=1 Tax=Sideroxydans lithotrophicus (strain ES-1) TaxID=580332 RepID=D5CSB9_SIDLE|nr:HypC/HybG/HupF family hydrogenase formation chaperone [Sideroxydans lithotrophicus]ADE11855.1 hydrogenase maturation protease [Sideroxydans lithotrophicus ES-1]
MCIGIPMQVVEVEGAFAWCEGRGRRERLNVILLEEVSPGDWVYATLGHARERITAQRAEEIGLALDGLAAALQGETDLEAYFPAPAAPQLPDMPDKSGKSGLKILVLGIGNTLLADEGVGIVVMQELKARLGADEDIEFLDGGTLSFTLAVPISECDALLVIDAAELGATPGTVRSFEGEAMDRFLGENRKSSVHEVGLLDLRSISLLTGYWPQRRALIGIQPAFVGWGEALTPAVATALPDICNAAAGIIGRFRLGAGLQALDQMS